MDSQEYTNTNVKPAPDARHLVGVKLTQDQLASLDHQCQSDGRSRSAQLRWLIARRALELAHNTAA